MAKISGYEPNLQRHAGPLRTPKRSTWSTARHDRRGDSEPGEHADLLPWLLSLDNGEVLNVLAPLVASTVDVGCEDRLRVRAARWQTEWRRRRG